MRAWSPLLGMGELVDGDPTDIGWAYSFTADSGVTIRWVTVTMGVGRWSGTRLRRPRQELTEAEAMWRRHETDDGQALHFHLHAPPPEAP